jgi:hypothetical protein
MAHLVLPDTQADPSQNQKSHFFANAPLMEIDTPMLSKIERGERKAKKEQVKQFAGIYKVTTEELLTLWLADQVYEMVKDEKVADNALKSVSKNINSKKSK